MLRSSLFTASALALVAGAAAQTSAPLQATAQRVTGPVKYAGTYNVQTKTWVRGHSAAANFGQTDNIYSNTAGSGYFSAINTDPAASPGGTVIDNAQIPSSSNPGSFSLGGLRDSSEVTGVQIGYCDLDINPGVSGWTLDFYNNYALCAGDPDPAQLAFSITATGLPSNGCWIVDLVAPGSTLAHDGDGLFDGVAALDTFGMAYTYAGTGTGIAGFLLTGDPVATDTGHVVGNNPLSGSNTYYGELGLCPGLGSGYNNDDAFQLNSLVGSTVASGCYFFGGYANTGSACNAGGINPAGSFYFEISGQDGGGGPGGPISSAGCTGNVNATGVPGDIEVNGSAVGANNDAVLRAYNLPLNQFGIFATGLAPIDPGIINTGNGTLCINPGQQGGLGRFASAGQIKNTGTAGEFTLDTNAGEWDLSLIPTSVGTYAAASGTTSYFQAWHREIAGAGWNFTGSCSVAWQ